MVQTFEVHNLERNLFLPEVFLSPEYHIEADSSKWICLSPENDVVERGCTWLYDRPMELHPQKGLMVQDVDSAAAIHECLA
jgi:hypothetical protein